MKAFRLIASFIAVAIMVVSFGACDTHTKDPYRRTVKKSAPLSQPIYGGASVAPFSRDDLFMMLNNEFIFKGRIEKIVEVDINYNNGTTENEIMVDQWLSVCDVKIENILYGEIPNIKDTVKVVSGQSTRCLASDEIRLLEGQEYYFITFIFDKKEPIDIEKDPIRIIEFGDVMAGTFYDLFPINDGTVSFQGWTFEGAKSTASSGGSITGGISTIDEDSFLKQFMSMLDDAKNKITSETTTPVETTVLPSEPAATETATDTPAATETASANTTGTPEATETAFIEPSGEPQATPSATN